MAAAIMRRSPLRVVPPTSTAFPRPSTTRTMPARVPVAPADTQKLGRSWPRSQDSRIAHTGVVARSSEALPASVLLMPKMKHPWYTTFPRIPMTIRRPTSPLSGRVGPGSRRTNSQRAPAAKRNRIALRARGSSSSRTILTTEKFTPQMAASTMSPRSVARSSLLWVTRGPRLSVGGQVGSGALE